MKFFKNRGVAAAVMVLCIVGASLWGLSKKPSVTLPEGSAPLNESLDTAYYEDFIWDDAGLLSAKAEKSLALYDANWDSSWGCIIGVATAESAADPEDAAWTAGEDMGLGEDDALLLLTEDGKSIVVANGTFYDVLSSQSAGFVDSCTAGYLDTGDFDGAALSLFGQVHLLLGSSVPSQPQSQSGGGSVFAAVFGLILLIVLLIVVFSVIDSIRYRSWNTRYGGMAAPVVVYRPILWWHRPGSAWFRRRRRPPMGGGPRPPAGGGPRPPMGGGPRPSGGGSRSGSFGGGSRGGSFGGGSRGGSFGGGSRSGSFGGGSRSGSFGGGSRSGSFGGGSRSGSFGGGSRGGSFGGGSRGGKR